MLFLKLFKIVPESLYKIANLPTIKFLLVATASPYFFYVLLGRKIYPYLGKCNFANTQSLGANIMVKMVVR